MLYIIITFPDSQTSQGSVLQTTGFSARDTDDLGCVH